MATRKEMLGKRDLTFSRWIRKKLPDSKTGYVVTDIDFYLSNYKKRRECLVEVKQYGADMKDWQKMRYKRLCKALRLLAAQDGWKFDGLYLIQFEKTGFHDGKCWCNYKEITEAELIKKLSFYD